jgi:hypothetical protein
LEDPSPPAQAADPMLDPETEREGTEERAEAPEGNQPDPSSDPGRLRRKALSPHVQEFLLWATEERDPDEIPHFTELGGRPIELGSWERDTLKLAQTASGRRVQRPLNLLAEGIAVQVKYLQLLDCFDHGPMPTPANLPQFLESLVTDVAIGLALLDEMQWDMNQMIGRKMLAEAKCLSRFQAKVLQVLGEVKQRIGTAELEEAERRAQTLVTVELRESLPDTMAPLPPERLTEEEPDTHNWANYGAKKEESTPLPPWLSEENAETTVEAPADVETPRNRLRPLLYVLFALIVIYGVVIFPRIGPQGPPVLNITQFSHVEAVRRIAPRPPSLFVQLNGEIWDGYTTAERRQQIEEIGRIAGAAGYNGVHARTDDGATVGQWLKKTGPRLIERAKQAS